MTPDDEAATRPWCGFLFGESEEKYMYNPYRTGIASGYDAYGERRQYRTEAQIREDLSAAAGDAALAGVEAAVVELPVEASEAEVVAA